MNLEINYTKCIQRVNDVVIGCQLGSDQKIFNLETNERIIIAVRSSQVKGLVSGTCIYIITNLRIILFDTDINNNTIAWPSIEWMYHNDIASFEIVRILGMRLGCKINGTTHYNRYTKEPESACYRFIAGGEGQIRDIVSTASSLGININNSTSASLINKTDPEKGAPNENKSYAQIDESSQDSQNAKDQNRFKMEKTVDAVEEQLQQLEKRFRAKHNVPTETKSSTSQSKKSNTNVGESPGSSVKPIVWGAMGCLVLVVFLLFSAIASFLIIYKPPMGNEKTVDRSSGESQSAPNGTYIEPSKATTEPTTIQPLQSDTPTDNSFSEECWTTSYAGSNKTLKHFGCTSSQTRDDEGRSIRTIKWSDGYEMNAIFWTGGKADVWTYSNGEKFPSSGTWENVTWNGGDWILVTSDEGAKTYIPGRVN
jgi:hypothetical protein